MAAQSVYFTFQLLCRVCLCSFEQLRGNMHYEYANADTITGKSEGN